MEQNTFLPSQLLGERARAVSPKSTNIVETQEAESKFVL